MEAGPEDGPLVILLHGFPEFWYGWRRQILPLAQAGYRVLVPDQRGYHISDKPRKLREYKLDKLAGDVRGLIDDADRDTAVVVGHDWGGLVAWRAAMQFPERVEKLVVLNASHPTAFRHALLHSRQQRRNSRYMLGFQVPGLPEAALSRDRFARLRRTLERSSRPGTFSDDDFERYVEAWSGPGALTGMLAWYRALRFPLSSPADGRVRQPTLLIWGLRDRFVDEELVEPTLALCDDARVERIAEATHWVQHEEPERVNRALLEFLGGSAPPGDAP